MELSLKNDLEEIPGLAERIDAFCEARGIAGGDAYAINMSVEELLTNTISYGYEDDGPHEIGIALELDGRNIVIRITDDGAPFDPSRSTSPDTEADIDERSIGGLGIFLVHELMDGIEYSRDGNRNLVTLRKRLRRPPRAVEATGEAPGASG